MGENRPEEEYAFLSIKVERFDFAVGESINVGLRTRRPWELSDYLRRAQEYASRCHLLAAPAAAAAGS
jgi:hypothetical protein